MLYIETRFLKSISKMKITAEQVAKVVPQRIFSLAVHPTGSKVLTFAGDKWGRLGLWDVVSITTRAADLLYTLTQHYSVSLVKSVERGKYLFIKYTRSRFQQCSRLLGQLSIHRRN